MELKLKKPIQYRFSHKMQSLIKIFKRDKYLYLLITPGVIFFVLFCYIPMYGAIIAFKDFNPMKGILGSEWVGLKWFLQFFHSMYFMRLIKNTVTLSLFSLLWGFPIPIIFALMLNEIKDGIFKRASQTISYLPHFISIVVVVGIMTNMLDPATGVVANFLNSITGMDINFLNDSSWFRSLYVGSGVWQEFGWNSIIYFAALSSIDPTLYEAARIDGASRFKQIIHITIPGLLPTAIILLILDSGNILSIGFVKVNLMYSPATYDVADVISTYVYRGFLKSQYSFSAAVDLFNSMANFIVLVAVNTLSRKVSETSLW